MALESANQHHAPSAVTMSAANVSVAERRKKVDNKSRLIWFRGNGFRLIVILSSWVFAYLLSQFL